jgi:hypothetical protein
MTTSPELFQSVVICSRSMLDFLDARVRILWWLSHVGKQKLGLQQSLPNLRYVINSLVEKTVGWSIQRRTKNPYDH